MIIFADGDEWYVDSNDETRIVDDRRITDQISVLLKRAKQSARLVARGELSAAGRAALHEAAAVRPDATGPVPPSTNLTGETPLRLPIRGLSAVTVEDALSQRYSTRTLLAPSAEDIATILFHSARIRSFWRSDDNFPATSRPSPSAGARHPFHLILVVNAALDLSPGVYLFDPVRCELQTLATNSDARFKLTDPVQRLLDEPGAPPVIVYLLAELRRTLHRYRLGMPLLLRDAGALLATIGITAAGAGLGACITATAGNDELNNVLQKPFPAFTEVGSIALGRRPESRGSTND